jgi:hypothetical protein
MQEESKNKKEKWVKPKLTIFTRGEAAEIVLASCKSAWSGGPHHMDNKCATLICVQGCDTVVQS